MGNGLTSRVADVQSMMLFFFNVKFQQKLRLGLNSTKTESSPLIISVINFPHEMKIQVPDFNFLKRVIMKFLYSTFSYYVFSFPLVKKGTPDFPFRTVVQHSRGCSDKGLTNNFENSITEKITFVRQADLIRSMF